MDYIFSKADVVALFVTLATLVAGGAQWIYIRRKEEAARQFSAFHAMVRSLVTDSSGEAPFIDAQLAVIYELRNFPKYYPVTIRILERSKQSWASGTNHWKSNLISEADKTISHIRKAQACDLYPLKNWD